MISALRRTIRQGSPRLYFRLRGIIMAMRRRRHGLRDVHPTFYMASSARVSPDLVAREYSFVNEMCVVGPRVELGRYVMLAPQVVITGGDHNFDRAGTPIIFSGRPDLPRTVVEDDAWVGYRSLILAGVRIGRGAIVAAGAVVTRDVPAYEIHGGIPARKIGERFTDPADRARHDQMLAQPARAGEYCAPLT